MLRDSQCSDENHPPWRPPCRHFPVNRAHPVVLANLGGLGLQLAPSHQICPKSEDITHKGIAYRRYQKLLALCDINICLLDGQLRLPTLLPVVRQHLEDQGVRSCLGSPSGQDKLVW